jgi:hypothetical protein
MFGAPKLTVDSDDSLSLPATVGSRLGEGRAGAQWQSKSRWTTTVAGAISEPARLYHCGGNVNKWIDLQQQQLPDDILVFLASILLISPAGRARVACRRARAAADCDNPMRMRKAGVLSSVVLSLFLRPALLAWATMPPSCSASPSKC